mmetsp:Transcript_1720/g.2697  ORF Transcript_1720/g.2697 Transcript_1720/m.2697 type:complete len:378 (+) Transcript_1720:71-1204(+)
MMLSLTYIVCLFGVAYSSYNWDVYSRYSHFTKRVSPQIYTGGRLTSRDIQYLAEGGFRSIISTLPLDDTLDTFNGMEGPFPSSEDEVQIAKEFGMDAVYFSTSFSVESVKQVSDYIMKMEKPVYIHCGAGYAASLFAELHLYLAGVVAAEDIYANSVTLGWDFQADENAVALVNELTGLSTEVTERSLEKTLANGEDSYKYYYWAHRVGNDTWYNVGQILDTHVESIAEAGYKSIISFRNDGESTTRLSSDPASGPIENHEFSDANGNYNVTAERIAFESVGLKFYNLPVSGDDAWTAEQLDMYTPTLVDASSYGPVLVHCTSGYRSSAYLTAYLARESGECIEWALQMARRIGYSFDVDSDKNEMTMDFYHQSLKC